MTTNTTQIEPRHVEQARELLAVEYKAQGYLTSADFFVSGNGDNHCSLIAIASLLAEHEAAQPTREQELEAMGEALQLSVTPGGVIDTYKSALARIMAPKPVVDPLVEVLVEVLDEVRSGDELRSSEHVAQEIRERLAARGLKIA